MEISREDRLAVGRSLSRILTIALVIGVLAGVATRAFIVAEHALTDLVWHGLPELLPNVPGWAIGAAIVAAMTALATLVVAISKGRPFDLGHAEAEYDATGRMEYRRMASGTIYSLLCLASGAAVGPEAPLTDINGGIGTFVAEKLKLESRHVAMMTYAGVAGAFSAFFGLAPVGALLAAELVNPKAVSLSRTDLAAGLAAGATGWVSYLSLGGGSLPVILSFSEYTTPSLTDVVWGVAIGAIGGVLGLVYGAALMKTRVSLQALRSRPWRAGLAGGAAGIIAAVISPYLLFSGQAELPLVLANAATLGILTLLGLGVAKLALSIWGLSTAYFGGPIFPIIFAGACFGLALNLAVPAIPQGVAVLAIVTGMTVAASAAPLSITFLFALIADPALVSITAAAAVASFVVRQVFAPTLPGVYRATQAEEARMFDDATGHAQTS